MYVMCDVLGGRQWVCGLILIPSDWLEMVAWCLYVSGISCAKSELKKGDPVEERDYKGRVPEIVHSRLHYFETKNAKCWSALAHSALCCQIISTASWFLLDIHCTIREMLNCWITTGSIKFWSKTWIANIQTMATILKLPKMYPTKIQQAWFIYLICPGTTYQLVT